MLKTQSDRVVRKYPASFRRGLLVMAAGTLMTAVLLIQAAFSELASEQFWMLPVSLSVTCAGAAVALWGHCHRISLYKSAHRSRSQPEAMAKTKADVETQATNGLAQPGMSQARN